MINNLNYDIKIEVSTKSIFCSQDQKRYDKKLGAMSAGLGASQEVVGAGAVGSKVGFAVHHPSRSWVILTFM